MTAPGALMAAETAEAPAAVARAADPRRPGLGEVVAGLRARPPRLVVTLGRGSSGHAALYARYLIETLAGVPVVDATPSTVSLYGRVPAFQDALLLAVSQSGHSPDLLAYAAAARDAGARVVAVVNDDAAPLAAVADQVVALEAGPERSVAATKTCLASMAALARIVAGWTGHGGLGTALDRLPDDLDRAAAIVWSAAIEPFARAGSALVAGRGPGLAAAMEVALKFKETARLHAEGMSAAELRHGPLALAGPALPVLVLAQADASEAGVVELAQDLRALGSPVFLAGPGAAADLALPPGLDGWTTPIVALGCAYRLCLAVALARGHDPDRPPHLAKVTRTR